MQKSAVTSGTTQYIRDTVLKDRPLHDGQQTYGAVHSVESALRIVVFKIERQIKTGEYALVTFLDIDGAFSATSYLAICGEAEKHGVLKMMVEWTRGIVSQESGD